MKTNFKFLMLASLALSVFFFTSCEQEDISPELQEISSDVVTTQKSNEEGLSASRVFQYVNGSGGRAIVSVKVVEGGTALEVQSRSSLRGGGNRLQFRHFITVNDQLISLGGSSLSITTDSGDKLHTRTYRNIKTRRGVPISNVESFSVDFIYSLIDRFNVASRPIVVAVRPTRFTLSAAGE